MNKNLLLAKMLENDKSAEDICYACEISMSAFSRKANGHSQFKQSEITTISKLLNLTPELVMRIFFE